MEKYLRLTLPADTRLTILRTLAKARNLATWRDARRVTFATLEPFFSQGQQDVGGVRGRVDVYTTFEHPDYHGWRVKFADEVEHSAVQHTGWYTDECGDRGTLRGAVARFTDGRFMAGYYNSENGEWVFFAEVFTSERDAAQYGDRQAEIVADDEREFDLKSREAADMRERLDAITNRLAELQVLIDCAQFPNASSEAARLMEEGDTITEKLNGEYADYV